MSLPPHPDPTPPPRRRPIRAGWLLAAAVLLVSLLLRAPISSVPPALAEISATLALTPTVAGMATALPLICFGVFAFITPLLAARVGHELTLWVAVALIVVGIGLRSVVSVGTFFGGITLIGLGIAIGNVIIPAIIRARFPLRVALMMALYSLGLQVSAALGAASTEPLLAIGWQWPRALLIWLVPAVATAVVWTLATVAVLRRDGGAHARRRATGLGQVSRRLVTWVICVFMGLQSLSFYALLTWIPQLLVDRGFSTGQAAVLLTVFSLLGMPGSFLGPRMASGGRGWIAIVAVFGLNIAGVLLLLFGGGLTVAGIVICGLCQGVMLAVALTFIAQQRDPSDVAAVSAMAQGIGYGLAAAGPLALGALYSATGDWVWPILLLAAALALAAVSGAWVARGQAARLAA